MLYHKVLATSMCHASGTTRRDILNIEPEQGKRIRNLKNNLNAQIPLVINLRTDTLHSRATFISRDLSWNWDIINRAND